MAAITAGLDNDFALQCSLTDTESEQNSEKRGQSFTNGRAPISVAHDPELAVKARSKAKQQANTQSDEGSTPRSHVTDGDQRPKGRKARNRGGPKKTTATKPASLDVPDQSTETYERPPGMLLKCTPPVRPPPGITIGGNQGVAPPPGIGVDKGEQWNRELADRPPVAGPFPYEVGAPGIPRGAPPSKPTPDGSDRSFRSSLNNGAEAQLMNGTASAVPFATPYVDMAGYSVPSGHFMYGPVGHCAHPHLYGYGPAAAGDGLLCGAYNLPLVGVSHPSTFQPPHYGNPYGNAVPPQPQHYPGTWHKQQNSRSTSSMSTHFLGQPAKGYGMMNSASSQDHGSMGDFASSPCAAGWNPYTPNVHVPAFEMCPVAPPFGPVPNPAGLPWSATTSGPHPFPSPTLQRPVGPPQALHPHLGGSLGAVPTTATANGTIFRNWEPCAGSFGGPEKQVNDYPEYDDGKLKRAAMAVYFGNMGMKAAAAKFNVTYADLKYYYDNDFRPAEPGRGDSEDESDEDGNTV